MKAMSLPMIGGKPIPACRWRTPHPKLGRVGCKSPKLRISPNGINPSMCIGCYAVDHEPVEPAVVLPKPAPGFGPGTELKELLESAGITGTTGCGCADRVGLMNIWGIAGCKERRQEIVDWLMGEVKKQGWVSRLTTAVKAVIGGLVTNLVDPIGALVDEAIHRAEIKEATTAAAMRPPLKWAYGITTVPERHATYLPKTIRSLHAAGFERPRLFVDGAPSGYDSSGYDITYRWPKTDLVSNWQLALMELYVREPVADRYAIFQDDVLAVKNMRAYLDTYRIPDKAYLNLVTFKGNEGVAEGRGWFPSRRTGRGIHTGIGLLGTVFTREGLFDLMKCESYISKRASAVWPHRNLDGCIADCLSRIGYTEMIHNPSLLSHIGLVSEKENGGVSDHAESFTWPGEDWDAMSMLVKVGQG